MQTDLKRLLDRLDSIRREHPELTSPEVRQALASAIFHGFIVRLPGYALPESMGLVSPEGNAAVRIALAEFLDAAADCAARTPEQRYAAFQNGTIESDAGNCYAKYFGYAPSLEALAAAMTRPAAPAATPAKPATGWWPFRRPTHPPAS